MKKILLIFTLFIGGFLSAQGNGDYVNMDGCEGTVYLTPEAAKEAAIAAGMNLDDPGNIPFPYHEHISEDGTTYYMLNGR